MTPARGAAGRLDSTTSPAWWVAALLVAVGAAYLPVFGAGFVWDDDLHLIDNAVLLENGLYRVWVLREEWIYWPVTFTSYWAEFQLWGLQPTGYHAVNVVLHSLSSLLVWRILLRLHFTPRAAFLAALVFALHPQNVESVAWIAQRKNTLSMLFFVSSVHAYLRFDALGDSPAAAGGAARSGRSVRRGRRGWYACSLVAFTLGMLSKGSIAPQPFVLLLVVALRRGFGERDLTGAAGREPWRRPIGRRDLAAIALFLVPAIAFPVHDVLREQIFLSGDVVREDSLPAKIAGAGWNAWFFVSKTAIPLGLCFVYPRWTIDPDRITTWIPLASALLILAAAAVAWWRGGAGARVGRALTFAAVYYALMLGPSLGFVKYYYLRYSYVADHYQYYAQLGLVALFAAGLDRVPRLGGRAFAAVSVALAVALGGLTFRYALAFADEETLWRDTLAKNPDASLALNNLGAILARRGESEEALSLLLRGTQADPTNREAWINAGMLQELRGEPDPALASFRHAIRHWPGQGGLSGAEIEGLSLAGAHVRLGLLRTSLGAVEAAEYHYRRAALLDPGSAAAQVGIGNCLLLRGAVGPAIASYQAALDLDPDAAEALEMLARIHAASPLAEARDAERAVAYGERAARVTQSRDARVLDALAAAYAEAGRFEEAVDTAAEAAALASGSGEPGLSEEIGARLTAYRRGEPHRMQSVRLRPVAGVDAGREPAGS